MPQTRSVCSRARTWNGQLVSVTASSVGPRLEALLLEHPQDDVPARPLAPRRRPSSRPRSKASRASASRRRLPGRLGLGHRGGQQVAGQVVAALGQGDRDAQSARRYSFDGPPGARPGAAGAPLEDDLEQPVVDEPVEVEGGGRARDCGAAAASSRLTGRGLPDDVVVEPAAGRLGQRGDRGHLGSAVVHGRHSRTNSRC